MSKTILTIAVLLVFISFSYAQTPQAPEQLTVTTYYPSPFGSYKELRADQMAIGSAYRTATLADGNLLVAGNVGIGTASPSARLEVNGNIAVTNPATQAINTAPSGTWCGLCEGPDPPWIPPPANGGVYVSRITCLGYNVCTVGCPPGWTKNTWSHYLSGNIGPDSICVKN